MKIIVELLLHFLSFFVPKKKRIVFGAWNGKAYKDNPRYFAEFLLENETDYELYWVGEKEIKDDIPNGIFFLDINDKKTLKILMTMKYAFVSHSYADLYKYNVFSRTKVTLMWHGIGIKNLNDLQTVSGLRNKIRSILRSYDYFLASSKKDKKRKQDLFKSYGAKENNVLLIGQSRSIKFFSEKTLINPKKIIYLPTFREKNQFSFTKLSDGDSEKLNKILETYDLTIVEKRHPRELNMFENNMSNKRIEYVKDDVSPEILFKDAAILITDYSSVVFDYLLFDRPIIHFTYDYNDYIHGNSGLYYDFSEITPGIIANDFDKLLESIELSIKNSNYGAEKRLHIKNIMLTYEDDTASKKLAEYFNLI